ncbi:hypothetical protein HHE02_12350 [Helicobacter heilmannii]|nr:hypothetical protein HHE02_12350 [Helicobacter heilmannii]
MGWSGTALEITNFKLDGQDPAPLVILVAYCLKGLFDLREGSPQPNTPCLN